MLSFLTLVHAVGHFLGNLYMSFLYYSYMQTYFNDQKRQQEKTL